MRVGLAPDIASKKLQNKRLFLLNIFNQYEHPNINNFAHNLSWTGSYRQVHARQKLPSFPVKVFSVDSATWNYTIWNKLLGHPKIYLKSNMAAKLPKIVIFWSSLCWIKSKRLLIMVFNGKVRWFHHLEFTTTRYSHLNPRWPPGLQLYGQLFILPVLVMIYYIGVYS